MAWANHKPPSGMPASGAGWGGDAKGAHPDRKPASWQPGRAGVQRGENGKFSMTDQGKLRAERTQELEDRLFAIAMAKDAAEALPVQVQAVGRLHAIYNGEPTKRVENTGKDGGPIEFTAATERADAAADIIARRLTPPATPGDPDG